MANDVNTPPTDAEVDEFIAGLSESDLVELKRQQLQHRAVTRQQEKDPDWGRMGDGEYYKERMRRYGF